MRDSPVYVLGTGLSHDGSVCLLADGEIVLAIEKERLTRRKHDGGNDQIAMEYVLDRAGITLDDVAIVVQNENFGMFRDGNVNALLQTASSLCQRGILDHAAPNGKSAETS